MKDPSIIATVEQLRSRIGAEAFVIRDHWESDPCAIGLAAPDDPGRLLYISVSDTAQGRYDVSLELPPGSGDELPYRPAGDRFDLDMDGLAAVLREHLGPH